MKTLFTIFLLIVVATASFSQQTQQVKITAQVQSCTPAQNYTHASLTGALSVAFTTGTPIVAASLNDTSFVVMGQQSGWHRSATLAYDSASNTITYTPAKPFFVGELVTAVATRKILYDSANTNVPIHGFAWQFYGMVTKQTRATFRDTEELNPGGSTYLVGLADMDESGNIDLLNDQLPVCSIDYNSGDGIHYQPAPLHRVGNIFPADYHLRGIMDAVVGGDSAIYDSNSGNRSYSFGLPQPFEAQSEYNVTSYLDFKGSPEIITAGLLQGMQTTFDTVNVYSIIGDSIIKNQSIHVGINSGDGISAMFSGDFNNDGAIDVGVNISGRIYILYNDGTGNLLPPQQANSTVGAGMNGWVAADMDNDGLLDLAGAIIGLGVEVDHNNGDGTFTPVQSNNSSIPFSKQTVSFNFNVGDCNGDGLMDAVLTPVDLQTDSMFVVTEKNTGNDSLQVTQIIHEGNDLGQHTNIFFGDMFHTGAVDPVISFEEAGTIGIFKNDSAISPISVAEKPVTNADGFSLNQNYPNPSTQTTTISYAIPTIQTANVAIYNATGHLMTTLVNGLIDKGMYTVDYDCTNLPSGDYYIRLLTPSTTLTKQFTILH